MKHLKQLMVLGSLLCTMAVSIPSTALAVPTLVTDRGTLGGNDFIDWSGFGPTSTPVVSGSSIVSNGGGITVTVTNPLGDFERRDQGSGWSGNFAPGDSLLWTANNFGSMTIEFTNPVFGAGAQIQVDSFRAFTGILEVYNGGLLLDSV